MAELKKSIRPPENWQDFETLCKKLFGEIWGCSNTIKKNGRLGQAQSGVDVYGKPKGINEYWGIQCKGKSNYADSKLTKKEIDEEIIKALDFKPKLKTFIFTTTALKDVEIEEYIRIKDSDSCHLGNFSIVLYSWEDIADLIEENRETYNWYVNQQQFKSNFDVEVLIKSKENNQIFKPKFLKTTNDYIFSKDFEKKIQAPSISSLAKIEPISLFGSTKVNHGWCQVDIIVTNNGGEVLEDWLLWLEFSNGVNKIEDDLSKDLFVSTEVMKSRTTWAYKDEKKIRCVPLGNSPLIQKISKGFRGFCLPIIGEKEVIMKWHLLARDFDREGEVKFMIEPEYELSRKIHYVDSPSKTKSEATVTYFIE